MHVWKCDTCGPCGIQYVNEHAACLETNWTRYKIEILRYYEIFIYEIFISILLYSYLEIFGRPASPWALTMIIGLSPWPATHLKGHSLISACTMGSANLRPIKRLASKTSRSLKVRQNCDKKTQQTSELPLLIPQWGRATHSVVILLMAEILHQFIGSLFHYL